ncbi:efflux RND transporter periplasmic adaptor subunit [Acidothermaceae bacterium B102]|nr:efflux RND transporter periplasmic adaptor subunit [Acidothermaceae bacterium B102]
MMPASRTLLRRAGWIPLTALVLAGCGGSSGKKPVVASVTRGEVREVVEAPATVTAKASATVTSPADGRVGKLLVRDGATVTQGQTLLVISSPIAQSRLKQAKAADAKAAEGEKPVSPTDLTGLLAASDTSADQAFATAQQAIDLIPAGPAKVAAQARLASSRSSYATSRSQAEQAIQSLDNGIGGVQQALATVAQAQRTQTLAAVSLAQQAISALTIKAPVAGIVQLGGPAASSSTDLSGTLSQLPSSVQGQAAQLLGGSGSGGTTSMTTLSAGTPVTTGSTLVTVTDASTLSLTADVDETDVLSVHPGVHATVDLDAVPDATYTATVLGIGQSPTTSAEGGVTYRVRLALGKGRNADKSAAPTPRPGMSAVVDMLVDDPKNVLRVPPSAVIHDRSRVFVWADDSAVARKAYITVGAQGDDFVEVLTGLTAGQRLVVQNAENLTEGQKLPR